jgi:hypothetical protein
MLLLIFLLGGGRNMLPEFLRFLATIQYMGVVRLPAKQDYFPGNRSYVLPAHHATLLNKTPFEYLWWCFHTSYSSGGAPDETTGVAEEEEEFFEEEPQEEEDGIEFAGDDVDVKEEEDTPPPTWYASIQGLIDHVNNASQKLCKHPGWKVSIDEMFRKFKGRSAQTYRMKGNWTEKDTSSLLFVVTQPASLILTSLIPAWKDPRSRSLTVWKCLSRLYQDEIIFSICLPWTTSSHSCLL